MQFQHPTTSPSWRFLPRAIAMALLVPGVLVAPVCIAQSDAELGDLAAYGTRRASALVLDPDRKLFPLDLGPFQLFNMESTSLKPFDSADHSTLLPQHLDDGVFSAFEAEALLFPAWSTEIGPAHVILLSELAEVLQADTSICVRIEAHTDNIGGAVNNQLLSERRAHAVKDWLMAAGIPAERMMNVGYGSRFPVTTNMNSQGRQLNRRVELRFGLIVRN